MGLEEVMTYVLQCADDGVPTLPLANFASRCGVALLALIKYLRSEEFRKHPKWAPRMPFDVETYDERGSLGHIVRPDIVLTRDGPRICEFDFVPSGRGWTMAGLDEKAQGEFLDSFADWYGSMRMGRVYYATGTVTTCRPETDYFASALRARAGLDIRSVNIDEGMVNGTGIVDRLFYRSELHRPEMAVGKRILTAEPWLDSKMIFAIVHDPEMTDTLARAIGEKNLAFLREVMIETHLVSELREQNPNLLAQMVGYHTGKSVRARRHDWLLKNTDVESDACWGCRGVVLGSRLGENVWGEALIRGIAPKRKVLGRNPVAQRFQTSVDFTPLWDATVAGKIKTPDHAYFGMRMDDVAHKPATRAVNARVAMYFLMSHEEDRVIVPPYSALTLRQDPLAHGAADARIVSYRLA